MDLSYFIEFLFMPKVLSLYLHMSAQLWNTYFAYVTVYTETEVSVHKQIAKESCRLKQNSCIYVSLKISHIFFLRCFYLGYWLFRNEIQWNLFIADIFGSLKQCPLWRGDHYTEFLPDLAFLLQKPVLGCQGIVQQTPKFVKRMGQGRKRA